jgi:uncharacterized protein (TIGR02145 family)
MKKLLLIFALLFGVLLSAQVKFGNNPTTIGTSSVLELESATKSLLISRVPNTASITAPVNGMIIYDLSSNCFKGYQGGFWSDCGFVPAPAQVVTSGGTAIVLGYACATAVAGTLIAGTPVSGVTQTITATVNTVGTYNISTTNANGVTFAGSGTFAGTGSQNIVLTATGTPTAMGNNTFTLNTTPNCSFSRTTLQVPGAPTSPVATVGNAQASVAFTAPVFIGSSAITGYTVTSFPGGITATGASSPIVVTGLTNGIAYTFTVVATNAVGNSVASTAAAAVIPFGATSGVLVAPGVTKQFLNHNLGADTSLNPHIPVVGLQGAYIQWGRRGPNTTGDSRLDWQTAGNTADFAAAPSSSSPNDAAIAGWSTTAAANGSWGATKTINDPCPTGYRVPTSAEWTGVNSNNTASRTGTFTNSATNYGSALHYGPNVSTKLLTLPATGYRFGANGALFFRGSFGDYWSSTESGASAFALDFSGSNVNPANFYGRTSGYSLRCIAE